ncbi:MAG: transposase [Reichenbachiella sp.]
MLLNLEEGWVVHAIETDLNKNEVYINIECILTSIIDESTDELVPVYDHAPKRTWRHLDTLQYKTFIKCALPRVKTSEGKVKTINPGWASGHQRHTFLFEHAVIDLLKATKNQTKTSEIMRCSFNLVNRILHLSTARGMDRRDHADLKFKHLSIDEKSFRKGHNYISVLSHPMSGCVLDVQEDRTKESCKKLINRVLSKEQRMEVQTISMDMWKAFMSSAQELLPKAQIVHDRFHLIAYLNKAIDQVRRREVKKHNILKESRYALLKNTANLTDKQWIKFKTIRNANYQVSKAWIVRDKFQRFIFK